MTKVKITVPMIMARKAAGPKIVQVTCYDYPTAVIIGRADVDIAIVGDSLAQVALGHDETLYVSMDDMIHHVRAVSRARINALVVADMPFLSCQTSVPEAIHNAGRLLQEGGATAVKIEGGRTNIATIRAIVAAGIPVMGHVGQVPQSIHQFGGFIVRGDTTSDADQILDDALAFQEAGAFAVTLEMMPAALGRRITQALAIPAISSGAGPDCDGQVMIFNDILGLNYGPVHPSCVKEYAALGDAAIEAIRRFGEDVRDGSYPGPEHSYP